MHGDIVADSRHADLVASLRAQQGADPRGATRRARGEQHGARDRQRHRPARRVFGRICRTSPGSRARWRSSCPARARASGSRAARTCARRCALDVGAQPWPCPVSMRSSAPTRCTSCRGTGQALLPRRRRGAHHAGRAVRLRAVPLRRAHTQRQQRASSMRCCGARPRERHPRLRGGRRARARAGPRRSPPTTRCRPTTARPLAPRGVTPHATSRRVPAHGPRTLDEIRAAIRTIPDYPRPGVMFRDITTLLGNARVFRRVVDELVEPWRGTGVDRVAGIEARGFILGGAVAHQLAAGFVPIRKKGKLPARHRARRLLARVRPGRDGDAPRRGRCHGERLVLVDDLIATGGTAQAAVKLLRSLGAQVLGACFIVDLPELGGAARLPRFRSRCAPLSPSADTERPPDPRWAYKFYFVYQRDNMHRPSTLRCGHRALARGEQFIIRAALRPPGACPADERPRCFGGGP